MLTFPILVIVASVILNSSVWFILGYWFGARRTKHWWQDEMIRRRHAVYHWENARWYWIEDEPKTPRDPIATRVANAQANK